MVSNLCVRFFGLFVVGLCAPMAQAQVWDLAADWSNSTNPAGAWSYNFGAAPLASHWPSWHDTGDPGWAPGNYSVPSWVQRAGDGGCWDIVPGQIYTHGDKDVVRGNVTWTAPMSGLFAVDGRTWWIYNDCPPSDHSGRHMDWRFFVNDVLVHSGNIGEGDAFSSTAPARFGGIVCVDKGDVLRVEYERTSAHSTIAVLDMTIETPPTCRADFDVSHAVDVPDLLRLLADWGLSGACTVADANEDGVVDILDLLLVLAEWGPCDHK